MKAGGGASRIGCGDRWRDGAGRATGSRRRHAIGAVLRPVQENDGTLCCQGWYRACAQYGHSPRELGTPEVYIEYDEEGTTGLLINAGEAFIKQWDRFFAERWS